MSGPAQLRMRMIFPGANASSADRTSGTSGRRVSMSLLRTSSTTIAMAKSTIGCWYARLRSTVTKQSNAFYASRNSAPFFRPVQPCSWTVLISCPTNSRAKRRGTHSSSRTRIGDQAFLRLFERGNREFAAHGRKVIQEHFERTAAFEIVHERLEGHPRPDKHGSSSECLGIAVNHDVGQGRSRCESVADYAARRAGMAV